MGSILPETTTQAPNPNTVGKGLCLIAENTIEIARTTNITNRNMGLVRLKELVL